MPPQPQQTMIDDMRKGFNFSCFCLESWGMCFLPILRRRFGVRGMEYTSVFSLLIIVGYAGLADSRAMLCLYLPAWLLAVIWRKLTADPIEHSSYQGMPFLTAWLMPNEYLARCAEAGLMVLIGALLSRASEAVGLFVSAGAIPLMGKYILEHTLHERRIRAAIDMQAEAGAWQHAMQEAARRQQNAR